MNTNNITRVLDEYRDTELTKDIAVLPLMVTSDNLQKAKEIISETGLYIEANDLTEAMIDDIKKVPKSELIAYLTGKKGRRKEIMDSITDQSVAELAYKVLEIKGNDRVADFGSGMGVFLNRCYQENPFAKYQGFENTRRMYEVSKAIAKLSESKIEFKLMDFMDLSESEDKQFDKVFADQIDLNHLSNSRNVRKAIYNDHKLGIPEHLRSGFGALVRVIIHSLKDDGRAVMLIPDTVLSANTQDSVRKYLIKNHLLEAIISLPAGLLLPTTRVKTNLMILSRNNQEVRMVNATNLTVKQGRYTGLSKENIDSIVKLLHSTDRSMDAVTVSEDDIKNNQYSLSVNRYLLKEVTGHTVKLKEVAEVKRGISISQNLFMSKPDENSVQVITPAGIENDCLSNNLPYVQSEEKYGKFLTEPGQIVIVRVGPRFKLANIKESKPLVVSGNLFVIKPDPKKINPKYLFDFLRSEIGQNELRRFLAGTAVQTISLSDLKMLSVPLKNSIEQKQIADKFEEIDCQIECLKKQLGELNKQKEGLSDLFADTNLS